MTSLPSPGPQGSAVERRDEGPGKSPGERKKEEPGREEQPWRSSQGDLLAPLLPPPSDRSPGRELCTRRAAGGRWATSLIANACMIVHAVGAAGRMSSSGSSGGPAPLDIQVGKQASPNPAHIPTFHAPGSQFM